jgi:hypothetical protein
MLVVVIINQNVFTVTHVFFTVTNIPFRHEFKNDFFIASFLNHDLHKVHILSSPACSCGAPQEDANHFFFVCYETKNLIKNKAIICIA